MRHLSFVAATAAALSACAQAPAPAASPAQAPAAAASTSQPDPTSQRCNAAPAQGAVGQYISDAVQETVRSASGAGIVRVLRFGQPITKEYNMQRVNLEVDSSGRVLRVFCG